MLMPLTGGFGMLLLVYIVMMLGQAFGVPAASAYAVDEGRTYGMGASMTLFMLSMQIGHGVGPIALGGLADWLGIESVFYAAAVCMAVGIVFFPWFVRSSSVNREQTGNV